MPLRAANPRRHRFVIVALLAFWTLNSVAVCAAMTRTAAELMACCHPVDCNVSQMPEQHTCCALNSHPTQPSVSPVVFTDQAADVAPATALATVAEVGRGRAAVVPQVCPDAPPGCNSVLRI